MTRGVILWIARQGTSSSSPSAPSIAWRQQVLQDAPDAGTVVRGTGGLRKLRIPALGRGKSGGARLLYLYVRVRSVIYFVSVYAKGDQEDITLAGYRYLARLVRQLKEEA